MTGQPFGIDLLTYPVQNKTVRQAIIRQHDLCPECGGELDTGWECNDCGFDASDIAYTEEERRIDEKYG